ncbi:phosphatase PAP2 family protein [Sphingomonas montana]|uniref:phosphatase PAP2 family protein n=1 Tax=Sphingomonas montana TaxID=1843236 RepID=UPI00096F4C89|nr:phosphatase PAP2 family protein [Sphingomonas montana]
MGKQNDKHRERARQATAGRTAVEKADAQVTAMVAPLRDTLTVRMTSAASEILDQPPLVALSAAVAVAGLATRNARLARAGLRMLASHALATLAKGAIKNRVDRSRPRKLLKDGDYAMEPGESEDGDMRSFPSGHTAGGVAVVRALAREYPGSRGPAGAALAAATAALIPKQAHYPSDIAAGTVIGWAAEAAVNLVWMRLEPHLPKGLATR